MKEFIKHIATEDDRQKRIVELKRLGDIPVILYGAGIYAEELTRFLNSLGINVADYVVDDDYGSQFGSNGMKPCRMHEIASRYERFHLLLGFCGNPDTAFKNLNLQKRSGLECLVIIDCRFYERFKSLNPEHLLANQMEYQMVFDWMEDDLSRKTFIEYVNSKLLYDSNQLRKLKSFRQYFPNDLPQFQPSQKDFILDGGAFTGDTLADVMTITSGRGCAQYYAFEPDSQNIARLSATVNQQKLDFVKIIPKGLWSACTKLSFTGNDGSRSTVSTSGTVEIEVATIDNFQVSPTFIKMDIEGSEYEALVGGAETIRAHRPNLAIALYHKPEDLLQIPGYIKSLCRDYRFYLRIHSNYSEELVLYATVRN